MEPVGMLVGQLDGWHLERSHLAIRSIGGRFRGLGHLVIGHAGHDVSDRWRCRVGFVDRLYITEEGIDRTHGSGSAAGPAGLGVVNVHVVSSPSTRSKRTSNSAAASEAPGRLPSPWIGSDWAAASATAARRRTGGRQISG